MKGVRGLKHYVMETYGRSEYEAPFILDLGLRWM